MEVLVAECKSHAAVAAGEAVRRGLHRDLESCTAAEAFRTAEVEVRERHRGRELLRRTAGIEGSGTAQGLADSRVTEPETLPAEVGTT